MTTEEDNLKEHILGWELSNELPSCSLTAGQREIVLSYQKEFLTVADGVAAQYGLGTLAFCLPLTRPYPRVVIEHIEQSGLNSVCEVVCLNAAESSPRVRAGAAHILGVTAISLARFTQRMHRDFPVEILSSFVPNTPQSFET